MIRESLTVLQQRWPGKTWPERILLIFSGTRIIRYYFRALFRALSINRCIIWYLNIIGFMHHYRYKVHGPANRLHWRVTKNISSNHAFFNTRSGHIYIGKGTMVGHGSMMVTGIHLYANNKLLPKPYQVPTEGHDIIIGKDCWIASGVIIIGGVKLGNNCIVAAGAVVTRSFGDNSFIAGVPAVARKRNGKQWRLVGNVQRPEMAGK